MLFKIINLINIIYLIMKLLIKMIKLILIIIFFSLLSIICKYFQADNVDKKAFYYTILSYNKLYKAIVVFLIN